MNNNKESQIKIVKAWLWLIPAFAITAFFANGTFYSLISQAPGSGILETMAFYSSIAAQGFLAMFGVTSASSHISTIRKENSIIRKAIIDKEIMKRAAELVKKEEESKKEETTNQN